MKMRETRSIKESISLTANTAVGYAAVFGKRSQNLGGFVEVVAPTAFTKTVGEADVRALFNHDPSMLLGRTSAGTLALTVDGHGLGYAIDLPDTQLGNDVRTLLERRDITGSSFGFRTIKDSWGETEDGYPLRTLDEVALGDVSPVTYPAYLDSEAGLRSFALATGHDLPTVQEAAASDELRSLLIDRPDEPEEASRVDHTGAFHRFPGL